MTKFDNTLSQRDLVTIAAAINIATNERWFYEDDEQEFLDYYENLKMKVLGMAAKMEKKND